MKLKNEINFDFLKKVKISYLFTLNVNPSSIGNKIDFVISLSSLTTIPFMNRPSLKLTISATIFYVFTF